MPKAVQSHTITDPDGPIVELSSPRKEVEDALYEIGVITDIITKLADAQIGGGITICGTSYLFLAELLDQRHNLINEQIAVGSFGRGG